MRTFAIVLCSTVLLAGCGGTRAARGGDDSGLPAAPAGSSIIYATETDHIPGDEASQITFEINYGCSVSVAHDVEPGRVIDIYVLTEEQNRRAASGIEPRVVGQDFIERHRDIHGSGGFVTRLEAGAYAIVLRNLSNEPVRVTSRVTGKR